MYMLQRPWAIFKHLYFVILYGHVWMYFVTLYWHWYVLLYGFYDHNMAISTILHNTVSDLFLCILMSAIILFGFTFSHCQHIMIAGLRFIKTINILCLGFGIIVAIVLSLYCCVYHHGQQGCETLNDHDHQDDIDTLIVQLRAAFNPNSHLANHQMHLIQPCVCPTLSTLRTFYIFDIFHVFIVV